MNGEGDLQRLLAQADWLRRLATYLVHDRAAADDVVQETWVAALRSPPEPHRPARPWLSQVLRNAIRMNHRGAARRLSREQAAPQPADIATAEGLLERMQLQRLVAEQVMELDEPYRTTLLLRFYEGREPTEIAGAVGVPAGTVRWRINEGLRRLRQRLDAACGGKGEDWRRGLLPLAGPAPVAVRPARTAPRWTPTALVGGVALVTLLGGAALWRAEHRATSSGSDGAPGSAAGADESRALRPQSSPRHNSMSEPQPQKEKDPMTTKNLRRAATLFGIVIPALAAAANEATLSRDEAVSTCVEMREKAFECKEPFIDAMIDLRLSRAGKTLTPTQRAKMRAIGLGELAEDGSGPRPPREAKCAAMVDRGKGKTDRAVVRALQECYAETDCGKRVTCMMPMVEALTFPKKP